MEYFTTGQVARLFSVAPRTAAKWFDQGRIKGFQLPGSNFRRFYPHSVIEFAEKSGMPKTMIDKIKTEASRLAV